MQTSSRSALIPCLFLLLIGLGTLFFRLGSLPFIGADEPRYARIAQEMQEAGRWVTPTLEYRPWLEKPPLYYWITIPFYSAFGVSETTARVGTALLTLVMTFAVFLLGRRLWGTNAGFIAAAMLSTSIGIIAYGRSASTDMPLTACMTVSLAVLCSVLPKGRTSSWKLWVGYAFLGLAVLGKGPVAFLLAAGIVVAFWCLDERGGSIRDWRVVSGSLIAAGVSLPWFWFAYRENGFAFIAIFLVNHNIARFITDIHHHTEPFWYYLPVLPALMFPWCSWLTLLAPDSLRQSLRRWREWNRVTLFLWCWMLVPLLFFSASHSKLPGYILPSIPPAALLLGGRISRWIDGNESPAKAGLTAWVQLALALALAVAFPLVFRRNFEGGVAPGLVVSAVCLIPALLTFRFLRSGRLRSAFVVTTTQGAILVITLAQVAFPAIGRYDSAKEIAQQMSAVREKDEPAVTYRFFHHALHYYTGYTLTEDFSDIPALDAFAGAQRQLLVVAEVEHLQELRALRGFSITILGSQGRLRLARLVRR